MRLMMKMTRPTRWCNKMMRMVGGGQRYVKNSCRGWAAVAGYLWVHGAAWWWWLRHHHHAHRQCYRRKDHCSPARSMAGYLWVLLQEGWWDMKTRSHHTARTATCRRWQGCRVCCFGPIRNPTER